MVGANCRDSQFLGQKKNIKGNIGTDTSCQKIIKVSLIRGPNWDSLKISSPLTTIETVQKSTTLHSEIRVK